jgi:hypothetical protein
MANLASTNSVFGARNTAVKPNPVQYYYMQTADMVQSGNSMLTKKAAFTLDTLASTNVVDDLFIAEAVTTSVGILVANIKFPITGIWSLCWTVRYLNTASENTTWLSVQNSKCYNDTTGFRRLASTTTTLSSTLIWTGYVFGLCAYSASTGNALKAQFYSGLIATLVSATAPRISATPVIPPVIIS